LKGNSEVQRERDTGIWLKPTVKRSVFVLVAPFPFPFFFFLSHVNLIRTNQFLGFNNWLKNQLLAGPFIYLFSL
jgi:hypothetical protein